MNSYQREHFDAFDMVRKHLSCLIASEDKVLNDMITDYLGFRSEVDSFLSDYFSYTCTQRCYQSRLSACCSREGIVAFFADVVVNAMASESHEVDELLAVLRKSNTGFKCIYLTENGCRWRVKPIVCEMFLCQPAKERIFGGNPQLKADWERLEQQRKRYTWPDRPVLFDALEAYFLYAGCRSPLMYFHQSPGLMRIKKKAGLL